MRSSELYRSEKSPCQRSKNRRASVLAPLRTRLRYDEVKRGKHSASSSTLMWSSERSAHERYES